MSLCCYSDNAVNVNSVCHCFSEIFIVCRRFFRIERKISKGASIIADQIQIRIIFDCSKFNRRRISANINFSILQRDQSRRILRNIAECKCLRIRSTSPAVGECSKFCVVSKLIGINLPRSSSNSRSFFRILCHCFFTENRCCR